MKLFKGTFEVDGGWIIAEVSDESFGSNNPTASQGRNYNEAVAMVIDAIFCVTGRKLKHVGNSEDYKTFELEEVINDSKSL